MISHSDRPPKLKRTARLPQCNKSNRLLRRYYRGLATQALILRGTVRKEAA